MKYLNLFIISILPFYLTSQHFDSIEAIRQVDSLLLLSRNYTDSNDFEKAIEINAKAEVIAFEEFGKMSAAYGSCCFNRGRVNYLKRDYPESEKWYLESRHIRQNVLGMEHLDYAKILYNIGLLYEQMGEYDKAKSSFLESKEIREKILGKEHPDYALSLLGLASMYRYMNEYDAAELYFIEHMDIQEKIYGSDHPEYATSLSSIAVLYYCKSDFSKAESFQLKASEIRGKALGKNHLDYASSLQNLGIIYATKGEYERAEPFYLESKKILEMALIGKEDPRYGQCLQNLALLYIDIGNFQKAEPFLLEVKLIRERILGKLHPHYVESLINLANLYGRLNNYEKEELLYIECKNIQENTIGTENPDYAATLNNLAACFSNRGEYKLAESYYFQALEIQEKVLGIKNPYYGNTMMGLADLYSFMGLKEKALDLHLEIKELQENTIGKMHPYYALNLESLASAYKAVGNYETAEQLIVEYKNIWESRFGQEHPDYSRALNHLVSLYELQSRYAESNALISEGIELEKNRISGAVSFLSETELTKYSDNYQAKANKLFNYLYRRPADQMGILSEICYDNLLFYKGFLLNTSRSVSILAAKSPQTLEIQDKLRGYRRQIAQELIKPIDERNGLDLMEEAANSVEKDLAQALAGYADVVQQVNWDNVKAALRPNEVAIEFFNFQVTFPKRSDSIVYVAFILNPLKSRPIFVPLFEEKQLSVIFQEASMANQTTIASLLYASRGANPINYQNYEKLYDLIWKPIERELSGIQSVYYASAGLLHRLNLGAIFVNENETISDRYRLFGMNSTRQLVIPTQVANVNNDAVLYGAIQFDRDSTLQYDEPLFASRSGGELSFATVDSTLRGGNWKYLAGTEREVDSIEKIMKTSQIKTNLRKAYMATEESFKNIGTNNSASPRILHIATHGYFFQDPKMDGKHSAASGQTESVFRMSDHPMLRSGLIMAGANSAWQGKQTLEGREDGILTAYEISQMNLSNTELVVLSACETGLGDIQGNEGVYGLQRAFKIAGAKYLIMSLWQVPDKQTSLLMTTFYRNWLEAEDPDKSGKRMSIPDAFHAAQKQLRDAGQEPFYWAGFVLVE